MITEHIEQTLFKKVVPKVIHHVHPVDHGDAEGLVVRVYDQMLRDLELVPPVTIHAAVPELLAGVWGVVRESMVAGPLSRAEREAVPAAVSLINECPFCVDVHSTMLHGGSEHEAAAALRSGRLERIPDTRLGAIVRWGLANRTPGSEILSTPPFSAGEAPQFIGTAVGFHYINRMVNVFLEDSPFDLLPKRLRWLEKWLPRVAGRWVGRRVLGVSIRPGDALELLPPAELPDDLAWAAPNASVAGAFARLAAVIDEVGRRTLSAEVRARVRVHVDAWNGEERPISGRWVEDALVDLDEAPRAAGRLALLTALASYRVTPEVVASFREHHPSDEQLIAVTAWASFTAARRVGTWLHPPSALETERIAVSVASG